ncbi:MAG: DUF3299 domain-containing protein [Verrucomicrobia bacterium]|nr:DUF3299 domain-containing protein [Verrucomicrobiota bacterium]
MKPTSHHNTRGTGTALLLALSAVALVFGGCSEKAGPVANTPSAPAVRGERIQKLQPAASATATVAKKDFPAGASAEPAEMIGEFQVVGFDRLASFNFDIPDESATARTNAAANASAPKEQIPATVRGLNGKKVALKGFMLPLRVEGGLITELLIMRDQSQCCYGVTPRINEWVSVKMTGKGVKPIMDVPITLFGKLNVGEMRENGYLVGIYAMDGEKMAGPPDL